MKRELKATWTIETASELRVKMGMMPLWWEWFTKPICAFKMYRQYKGLIDHLTQCMKSEIEQQKNEHFRNTRKD